MSVQSSFEDMKLKHMYSNCFTQYERAFCKHVPSIHIKTCVKFYELRIRKLLQLPVHFAQSLRYFDFKRSQLVPRAIFHNKTPVYQ